MDEFYSTAVAYWSGVSPTVEGVLGGFGALSEPDVAFSERFLLEAFEGGAGRGLALDCGAGIGRITKGLLGRHFAKVDLVEQNAAFLEEAKSYVGMPDVLGDLYARGLQDFEPTKRYDVVWCQWVLGHLKDDDLIRFFISCRDSLNENGLIIVKENVTSSNRLEKDETDSSVTRPLGALLSIFKRSKLKIVRERRQTDFPRGLYPVYMFALRPRLSNKQKEKEKKMKSERATAERLEAIRLTD